MAKQSALQNKIINNNKKQQKQNSEIKANKKSKRVTLLSQRPG